MNASLPLILAQALAPFAPPQSEVHCILAKQNNASVVLADIAEANAELLIPRSQFNDDDWYVYRPDTLELIEVIGASETRATFYRPVADVAARRGLRAKSLGLWRYA